ncbi:hypothetical protein [Trichococcus pasteurii]|uniref:Uncharacterized protein n=1 Tax=Trichococcus pasteurii TaxID=43064 RepID=A0A1W1IFL6_9LACT|nr:hypothetical protein [Trichococcus pasteurii]SFE46417.1 hypothetical protein SAMN04488086_10484 [Trichococcus pasteurii]SLM51701.1 Hypothetical protein TPAS_1379 [Trichococcus pasteurii]SSB92582.1 Hypothetical protein TPAS_1379 [Trichococcus pasteurii]
MRETLKKFSYAVVLFIFASFILITGYEFVRFIQTRGTERQAEHFLRLVQVGFGLVALLFPSLLRKHTRILLPQRITFIYAVFLYLALLLGSLGGFYDTVAEWDTIQHALSSALFGVLGFSVIANLQEGGVQRLNLTPVLSSLFSFCLATTIGVLWEFYEFFADSVMGQNTQRTATIEGVPLIGQAALMDTMGDLIVNCSAAAIVALLGYFALKSSGNWLEGYLITFDTETKNNETD